MKFLQLIFFLFLCKITDEVEDVDLKDI